MINRCLTPCLAIVFAWPVSATIVMGQADAIDAANVLAIGEKVAATYQLGSADGRRRFQLVQKSRLEWSKNTEEDVYGNVFIWTDQGVPAAVASIFKFVRPKDDVVSEFHSLSVGPIQAKVGDTVVWKPATGGLQFEPLANAPPVASRKTQRVAQMRSLARQFRAEREISEGNITQLRFLSTPILVYQSEEKGVLAGAIFAFVDQTDPEVWLIIEARATDNGPAKWHRAVARMNTRRLKVSRRDTLVFEVDRLVNFEDPLSPYALFQRLQDNPEFKLD